MSKYEDRARKLDAEARELCERLRLLPEPGAISAARLEIERIRADQIERDARIADEVGGGPTANRTAQYVADRIRSQQGT